MLVDNRLSVLQMYPGLGYVLYIFEQYTYQCMHLHMIWPDRSRLGLKKTTLRRYRNLGEDMVAQE
jgi:hypothetical protein